MPDGGTPKKPETLEEALSQIDELAKDRDAQKEHARTWEQRAKDNKDAAPERDTLKAENETLKARVGELEAAQDSSKSEVEKQLQKLADDLEAEKDARGKAEAQAAADKLTSLKTRIGAEKGLPSALIERLAGTDEESVRADAEKLAEIAPAAGNTQWPDLGQGKQGDRTNGDKMLASFESGLNLPKEQKE